MKRSRLDLAFWTVDVAKKYGADQVAVVISDSRETEVECREGQLDKFQQASQHSLAFDIYLDFKYSGHSTNDLSCNSIEKLIKEAIVGTKFLVKDLSRCLPDPHYYPKNSQMDLDIYDKNCESLEDEKRIAVVHEIEQAAKSKSDKIISATASYSDATFNNVKVHSNGFVGESKGSLFSAGTKITVKTPDGNRVEDVFHANVRFWQDLPGSDYIAESAVNRALQKIGQKKIASGIYNMVVENRVAGRLLTMLISSMSARALQQKKSFLEGKIGEKITSNKLTMIDFPFLKKGLGSRFYDGDGIATQKRTLIDKGILNYYFVDNYYGRKLKMPLTIGGPSNLTFEHEAFPFNDLIKEMNNGVVVTGFIGGNFNSATGDFSYGITGLLVKNGKIIQPVNEMNISGNATDLWRKLINVGNDAYPYSSVQIPSLAFEGVHFSGI